MERMIKMTNKKLELTNQAYADTIEVILSLQRILHEAINDKKSTKQDIQDIEKIFHQEVNKAKAKLEKRVDEINRR